MAVEHRGVRFETGLVNFSSKLKPTWAVGLVIADPRTRRLGKDLSSAAGTRIHSGRMELFDKVLVRHLVKLRHEIKLDHRKGFQMELWKFFLKRRKKVGIIREWKLGVQPSNDVKFRGPFGDRGPSYVDAFLDRMSVCILSPCP